MGKKFRRSFTREFKLEAIRLATAGDKTVRQVARELEVDSSTLHTWIREAREKPATAFPGTGKSGAAEEEVRRLRRELDRVTEERDILKKAAAFFAKESR